MTSTAARNPTAIQNTIARPSTAENTASATPRASGTSSASLPARRSPVRRADCTRVNVISMQTTDVAAYAATGSPVAIHAGGASSLRAKNRTGAQRIILGR